MINCEMSGRCTTTTGWLKLPSDIDAEVMFPVEDEPLELARVNPWQLGNPKGSVAVIHGFPDDSIGLQEAPLIAALGIVTDSIPPTCFLGMCCSIFFFSAAVRYRVCAASSSSTPGTGADMSTSSMSLTCLPVRVMPGFFSMRVSSPLNSEYTCC